MKSLYFAVLLSLSTYGFSASDISVTVDGQVYRCSGSGTGPSDQYKTYCQCYTICGGCFQQLQLRSLNLRTGEDKLVRTINAEILPEGPNGDVKCLQQLNANPVCR
ncbi:MAG: hypothetical protein NT027_00950 [Proteobacteria bacterium]|nr:hypothetical protein [Pseudomonadota bacterium]